MKRTLINSLKLAVSAGIIAWLVVRTQRNDPETFSRVVHEPKDWGELGIASVCVMLALVITIVRWHLLVRALRLPFLLKDAFRLGFLGYFWNFFLLGSVGGDLVKAVFIAREHRERRAEAVATVFVDRVIGLYALFIVATIAILMTGLYEIEIPQVRVICQAAFFGTFAGLVGLVMLIVPGFTSGKVSRWLSGLPQVGAILGKLIGAIRIYRSNPAVLVVAVVMSLGVHSLLAVGIYLVARGLPGDAPDFGSHFVAVPMAMLTGALPLPAAGLGAFEAALEFLYVELPAVGVTVSAGQGLLVALTYRVITLAIALVGACYYISARREMDQLMESAESLSQDDGLTGIGPPHIHAAVGRQERAAVR